MQSSLCTCQYIYCHYHVVRVFSSFIEDPWVALSWHLLISVRLSPWHIQHIHACYRNIYIHVHKTDKTDVSVASSLNETQITDIKECDYLILSKSIFRIIILGKFSPNGKILKQFVRGGIEPCANFSRNHCSNILQKNIINVGTRDIRNPDVMQSETV